MYTVFPTPMVWEDTLLIIDSIHIIFAKMSTHTDQASETA
jgi:hypothetical protein